MADLGPLALVVGGASGVGAGCAAALADAGHRVVIADLRMTDADSAGVVASVEMDVRDRDRVHAAVAEIVGDHGPLQTVVNAAGTARVTPILDITPKEWDLVLGVNLQGAFNVLQAAVPEMADGGSIVMISSIDARSPVAGLAHYCAAKAGLESLVRSAALELGGRGIRVNTVAPGVVRTPLMQSQLARPDVERAFLERIPLSRIADPPDIAGLVAFLASPAASWITGASIPVDGGMSLREHPELLRTQQSSQETST